MTRSFNWFKGKVEPMLEIAEKFKGIYTGVYYDTGAWSVIKLIALGYFVHIYTRIIPRYFKHMRYIEFLSGAGLCKIKDTGDIVAGSPLVAAIYRTNPFDEYILIESNEERAAALQNRMELIANNVKVIIGDCNDCIPKIIDNFERGDHYLAFVDCEGLEVNWSTIYSLLRQPGDLIFNFQSSSVARVAGRAKGGSFPGDLTRLNTFYGDERWIDLSTPEELLEGYILKIKEESDRQEVVPLPVKGPGSFRYDLILATRRTKGRNPWLDAMRRLREDIQGYSGDLVKDALDILTGRIIPLEKWFKEEENYSF